MSLLFFANFGLLKLLLPDLNFLQFPLLILQSSLTYVLDSYSIRVLCTIKFESLATRFDKVLNEFKFSGFIY